MNPTDEEALKAKGDERYRELFIQANETYLLRSASRACGCFITRQDDRWSISLSAFHEAIREYSQERGSFAAFASLVVKRRLLDYARTQTRLGVEDVTDPQMIPEVPFSHEESARWEIEEIAEVLGEYGFAFSDLAQSSPKSEKTKMQCAKVISTLAKDPELLAQMRRTHLLPIALLQNRVFVPRKLMERHRKYIIAATEILTRDCPILCGYLKYVKEEFDHEGDYR